MPPFLVSSPSLANDDDSSDFVVMSSIKKADRAAAERYPVDGWPRHGADGLGRSRAAAAAGRPGAKRQQPLGQLLKLGEADGEVQVVNGQRWMVTPTTGRRKVHKQKPIVPLVVPLINAIIFSEKKRMKDKENLYLNELYSLLRLR
ncbi:hypothetical protein ABZP36_033611 [Zizania latifolia]